MFCKYFFYKLQNGELKISVKRFFKKKVGALSGYNQRSMVSFAHFSSI
jgi:hypothetical protein